MELKEWRAKQRVEAVAAAVELTLPSGLTILARRPDPMQMLSWGRLPLGLAAAAAPEGGGGIGNDELLAGIEFSRQLLQYCFVKPQISLDPKGDSEIHPREIPLEDSMWVMRWARRTEETEKVRSFRGIRPGDRTSSDGGDVRTEAVGDGDNLGPDGGTGVRLGDSGGTRPGEGTGAGSRNVHAITRG